MRVCVCVCVCVCGIVPENEGLLFETDLSVPSSRCCVVDRCLLALMKKYTSFCCFLLELADLIIIPLPGSSTEPFSICFCAFETLQSKFALQSGMCFSLISVVCNMQLMKSYQLTLAWWFYFNVFISSYPSILGR